MLSVQGLHVRYGHSVVALHGIDLELPADGVLAVLGGNGAGKSTLLRAVSGTLRMHRGAVAAGRITFGGRRIDGLDPAAVVRAGVVGVPEGRQVFARMTVAENLRAGGIGARTAERRRAALSRVHDLFPVLAERAGQRAGLLSGGEQQMLAIGRALMSAPKVLLLDEPSLGLAPKMVARIGEIVREVHEQGTAVVLVEQNAAMALAVADHAVVLETGRLALAGPAGELAGGPEVRRLYLGGHAEPAAAGPTRTGRLSRWAG